MRTPGMLLVALVILCSTAYAQEAGAPDGAIVKSAQVSGLSFDRLSPGLRQDINALAGVGLNRERVDELASRIEAERPNVIVAVRSVQDPDGQVRVVFLVARVDEDQDVVANVNARYPVESVELTGVPETNVSQALRDDLQKLVGSPLDPEEAKRLDDRLSTELPGYDISRRISRGKETGRIRLVFHVEKSEEIRWLHFAPSQSKFVYHSDQGWSGLLDIPMGGRDHRATVKLAFGNDDDLIEEYSGFGLLVESRKVVTERLGLSLGVSRYHQTWQDATLSTLAANPRIPEAYRVRATLEPSITFAFNPHVRVAGGVSATELESLSHSPDSQMASAVVVSVGYDQRWNQRASRSNQTAKAGFEFRSASTALQSDLVYKRYFAEGSYEYRHGDSTLTATASLGRITGEAPLFERFSLGDSSTLRGWDKFDIAPAGGDRVFHQSIEYGHRRLAFFIDTGAVWDHDRDMKVRVSTGFGYHHDKVFLTLGFPVNTSDLRAMFMMGVRF